MTPYEFADKTIQSYQNKDSFAWCLDDGYDLAVSHQRMYALIQRIEAAGEAYSLPDAISEEITAIIAEMEPKK